MEVWSHPWNSDKLKIAWKKEFYSWNKWKGNDSLDTVTRTLIYLLVHQFEILKIQLRIFSPRQFKYTNTNNANKIHAWDRTLKPTFMNLPIKAGVGPSECRQSPHVVGLSVNPLFSSVHIILRKTRLQAAARPAGDRWGHNDHITHGVWWRLSHTHAQC